MSENSAPLGREVFAYLTALRQRWIWWVAGSFPAALVALYQGGGGAIPAWCLWSWALLGIQVAAFLAWRDEHRKVKCRSLRAVLTKVVDMVQGITIYETKSGRVTPVTETIEGLISVCDEFGDESDVEWVCQQLSQSDNSDPFQIYEFYYGAASFKGKRLKFLRDARVSGGRFIKNDIDAIGYIRTFWGSRNGLRERNEPIYPVKVVDGRIEFQDQMCQPRSAAKEERLYLVPPTLEVDGVPQTVSTPEGLPNRQSLPETASRAENELATLVVPDPMGQIPGVKR